MPDNSAQLRTIEEAMSILRCGRSKINELHEQGKIEIITLGHRSLRVTQVSIDRFLKENRKSRRKESR